MRSLVIIKWLNARVQSRIQFAHTKSKLVGRCTLSVIGQQRQRRGTEDAFPTEAREYELHPISLLHLICYCIDVRTDVFANDMVVDRLQIRTGKTDGLDVCVVGAAMCLVHT